MVLYGANHPFVFHSFKSIYCLIGIGKVIAPFTERDAEGREKAASFNLSGQMIDIKTIGYTRTRIISIK